MKYISDNLSIVNSTSHFQYFLDFWRPFCSLLAPNSQPFCSLFSHSGFPGMPKRENRNNATSLLCKKTHFLCMWIISYTCYSWWAAQYTTGLKMQVLNSWTTRHLAMVARAHSFSTFSQSQHNFKLFNTQFKSFECLLEEFSPIHSPP